MFDSKWLDVDLEAAGDHTDPASVTADVNYPELT
jgi:hypothetical protein